MRISRKRIKNLCDILNFELIIIQQLGNRHNYWYTYNIKDIETGKYIISNESSLKKIYDILINDDCGWNK